jgi:beta-glucosidase
MGPRNRAFAFRGEAFEVRAPYNPLLAEALKEAGGRWSGFSWHLPLFALPAFLRGLKERGLSSFPKEVLEGAKEAFKASFAEAAKDLEAHPLLLPEQKEDAKKVLRALYLSLTGRAPKAFLLANGTGTGKTYVYAGVIRAAKAVGLPALLVVPNEDLARQVKEVLQAVGAEAEIATYGRFHPKEARGKLLVLDEAHLAKRGFRSERGRRVWWGAREARFVLFATATPFDRPWESEYLLVPAGVLEAWGEASFEAFMARFSVHRWENPWGGYSFHFTGGTEDLRRFHDTLKERGFVARRLYRPPEGLVEHEVRFLDLPKEEKALLAEVRRRLREAVNAAPLEERGMVSAQRTMLSRALLERYKLKASFPLLEELLGEGWHVALFLQYRSDKELDLSTEESFAAYLEELEEEGRGSVARQIAYALMGLKLHLPSPTGLVRERFGHLGEALAFYTGAEGGKALREAKERWNAGDVRLLVLTAQKGGTGLSLHDTTGKRPTAQVVMTLPWTGTQLDQVLGRVVRVGLASPVKVVYPAARVPFERKLAGVVAGSLRTLGHAVRGGEMPVPDKVIQAFLHDLAAVDPEGFWRMMEEEEEVLT